KTTGTTSITSSTIRGYAIRGFDFRNYRLLFYQLCQTMSTKRTQRTSIKSRLVWDSDTAIVFDPTEQKLYKDSIARIQNGGFFFFFLLYFTFSLPLSKWYGQIF